MRIGIALFLLSLTAFAGQGVNWVTYPKVNPWDFETRPHNHANIDPEIIRGWLALETPMRSVDRAKAAVKAIMEFAKSPHLRAVLMRDVLNLISDVDPHFMAADRAATNGVLFIGRAFDTETRYALGISFDDGHFYRGPYHCALDTGAEYTVDFSDRSRWTPVIATP